MGKMSRDQIKVMVASVAERLHQGPQIDSPTAVNLIIDALFEGQGKISRETFGAAIGGAAYFLNLAADEALSNLPPAGRA